MASVTPGSIAKIAWLPAALGGEGDGRVVSEVADLWFHSMVLLASRGIPLRQVFEELARRHGEKSKP